MSVPFSARPRPEEPAQRASRRTATSEIASILRDASQRKRCDAPQDEVAGSELRPSIRSVPWNRFPALRRGGNRYARAGLLVAKLQAVERGVASAFAQQFLVPAGFGYAPILDDEDAIGVHHGVQPMRDHDCGASAAEMLDGALH